MSAVPGRPAIHQNLSEATHLLVPMSYNLMCFMLTTKHEKKAAQQRRGQSRKFNAEDATMWTST